MSVAPCVYADDAYLIAAFPGVVVTLPEKWLVTVLAAGDDEEAQRLQAVGLAFLCARMSIK